MNIGYACLNNSIGLKQKTFRIKSYSEELLKECISNNINYLKTALLFNIKHNIFFFRISSDLVPFASHPICTFDWQTHFAKEFKEVGDLIKKNKIRISMHPDQFVVLNSKSEAVVQNAIRELMYHAQLLESLGLNTKHKLQIHVGGLFGEKEESIARFIKVYKTLPQNVKDRLVIENDDRLYSLKDCLEINKEIGIPILFDIFHHQCLNNGEPAEVAFKLAAATWKKKDGTPMMDYSSQQLNERVGKHSSTIDIKDFKKYISFMKQGDFEVMLEIKDKELSAIKALEAVRTLNER